MGAANPESSFNALCNLVFQQVKHFLCVVMVRVAVLICETYPYDRVRLIFRYEIPNYTIGGVLSKTQNLNQSGGNGHFVRVVVIFVYGLPLL